MCSICHNFVIFFEPLSLVLVEPRRAASLPVPRDGQVSFKFCFFPISRPVRMRRATFRLSEHIFVRCKVPFRFQAVTRRWKPVGVAPALCKRISFLFALSGKCRVASGPSFRPCRLDIELFSFRRCKGSHYSCPIIRYRWLSVAILTLWGVLKIK